MTPKELPEAFAKALASACFKQAAAMLGEDLRASLSAEGLEDQYKEMIEYGDGHAQHIELLRYELDWPQKGGNDIAWAYVAVSGNGFSEAITVVVADEGGRRVITSVEWGEAVTGQAGVFGDEREQVRTLRAT